LRNDNNIREIGIRGDCVYAIYSAPKINDIYEVVSNAFYINTFMRLLNKLLTNKKIQNISVGIGVASVKELVVKAGRYGTGISNKVWIGNVITKVSSLSSLGNKSGKKKYYNIRYYIQQYN
jgi:hypothetical protein